MAENTHAVTNRHETRRTGRLPTTEDGRLRWGARLIALAGLLFVVHGIGFLYRTYYTSGFEMGVNELDGMTASELAATYPDVASYITHVHVSFAGLMIAAGIGIAALAWFGIRAGKRWALSTAFTIPLIFAAFTLPVHQTVHFHFHTLIHLGPAAIGFPLFVGGGILAALGIRSIDSPTGGTDE